MQEERKSTNLCESLEMVKDVNRKLELVIANSNLNGCDNSREPMKAQTNMEEDKTEKEAERKEGGSVINSAAKATEIPSEMKATAKNETETTKKLNAGEEVAGNKDDRPQYMCVGHRKGNCEKGAACTYRHIEGDIKPICNRIRAGLECQHGRECRFRHFIVSRREDQCKFQFRNAGCSKGNNCVYYHLTQEERREKQEKEKQCKEKEGMERKSTEEAYKPTSDTNPKNGMELEVDIERIVQIQLMKILMQSGGDMEKWKQMETRNDQGIGGGEGTRQL